VDGEGGYSGGYPLWALLGHKLEPKQRALCVKPRPWILGRERVGTEVLLAGRVRGCVRGCLLKHSRSSAALAVGWALLVFCDYDKAHNATFGRRGSGAKNAFCRDFISWQIQGLTGSHFLIPRSASRFFIDATTNVSFRLWSCSYSPAGTFGRFIVVKTEHRSTPKATTRSKCILSSVQLNALLTLLLAVSVHQTSLWRSAGESGQQGPYTGGSL